MRRRAVKKVLKAHGMAVIAMLNGEGFAPRHGRLTRVRAGRRNNQLASKFNPERAREHMEAARRLLDGGYEK